MVQTNETNWEFILFTSRQWMMMIQLLLIFIFPTLRMLELYWVWVWWLLENHSHFHPLSIFSLQADWNGLQMCSFDFYMYTLFFFRLLENTWFDIKAKIWLMSRVLQGEVVEFVMVSKLVWQALRNCQICLCPCARTHSAMHIQHFLFIT